MPLCDITNPEVIKFLVDSYTALLRMKWNDIHQDTLKDAAILHREEKGYLEADVVKARAAAGMAMTSRHNEVAARNRRLKPIRDTKYVTGVADLKKTFTVQKVGLCDVKDDPRLERPDTDLRPDPIMRPIDPKHKEIIYKDIPNFGRKVYLKSRSKILPEDRYYFRETSSWDHGWRIKESYFKRNAPAHGRVWRLSRDRKSVTGPHPDPPHYKSSEITGPIKC